MFALLVAMLGVAAGQTPEGPPSPDEPPAPVQQEAPIVEGPSIIQYIEAPYPAEALEAEVEGIVKLRIALSADGEVENLEVMQSPGFGFDEAAVDAVLQMTFAPARTEEGPIPVVFEFDYGFQLTPAVPDEDVPPPINVEGTVTEMATRKPIAGAQVAVEGTDLVAETNESGEFELRGAPIGEISLRILHVGHVTLNKDITVTEGDVTVARLWMRAESYRNNELVARYAGERDEVTRRTITIEEVRRVPGTFGDPVKVIQTLPGAARTPFGTGLLVIRGADPEDSGVYVDGIRVPIIYHLTGTTSILSPDLIESVDYLPGGYNVKFGRTMGGTVNVNTKSEFDENGKLVWGTDILDSQVYFEGQLGKKKRHGLAVGARRSYIDVFIPLLLDDSDFSLRPRYWDYQLKYVPQVDNLDLLSVFVYGSDDQLEVATPDDVPQGSDQDTQGNLEVGYTSHRIIGHLRHAFSDRVELDVVPSIGIDTIRTGLGQDFSLRSRQLFPQIRAELSLTPHPTVEIVPGLDLLGGWYSFDFRSSFRILSEDDPLAEREPVGFDGSGLLFAPDPYLRVNLRPFGGSDRWLISPGIRYNNVTFTQAGEIVSGERLTTSTSSWDPRIATRLQVIPDGLVIKAATGWYHQPPQPQEALGLGAAPTVGFERSWSTTFGWEQRLTDSIHYDVDVFYRQMTDLVILDSAFAGFGSSPFVNGGEGRAYGVEVIARHDPVGRFFGWVSYTLSRASRRDPDTCVDGAEPQNKLLGTGPCWLRFDFDQTHIFSAQAGYDLPFDFGVSAQVQYVTGNPTSTLNAGIYDADTDSYQGFRVGQVNADRLPSFFQTSLRFDKLWTFRKWQLETYVDLLNLVRGVNPEFAVYDYDFTEVAYVRGLPFIPNIGIEAKFFP